MCCPTFPPTTERPCIVWPISYAGVEHALCSRNTSASLDRKLYHLARRWLCRVQVTPPIAADQVPNPTNLPQTHYHVLTCGLATPILQDSALLALHHTLKACVQPGPLHYLMCTTWHVGEG